MSVGIVTTKGTIDATSGMLAQQIAMWTRQVTNLQDFLVATPDVDLQAMGYTPEDVALLKSAAGDMNKLAQIYYGEIALPEAYAFETFILRIAGLQV